MTLDDQTLQNFDFKFENSNDGTITYKPKDFIDFEYPMILFYFTPENIENNIGSKGFQLLDIIKEIKLTIHTDIEQLEPYDLY